MTSPFPVYNSSKIDNLFSIEVNTCQAADINSIYFYYRNKLHTILCPLWIEMFRITYIYKYLQT